MTPLKCIYMAQLHFTFLIVYSHLTSWKCCIMKVNFIAHVLWCWLLNSDITPVCKSQLYYLIGFLFACSFEVEMKHASIREWQDETRNVFLISTFPQVALFSGELKGLFSLSALFLSESALVSKASISSETNHKITTWLFCGLLALLPFISP